MGLTLRDKEQVHGGVERMALALCLLVSAKIKMSVRLTVVILGFPKTHT